MDMKITKKGKEELFWKLNHTIMKKLNTIILLHILLFVGCHRASVDKEDNQDIEIHISPYVRNAQTNPELKILKKWESFLHKNLYYEWDSEDLVCSMKMPYPMMPLQEVINKDVLVHHYLNILGIYPIDSNLYCIKNSLITQNADTIYPAYQFSVFAKLEYKNIRFMSNPQIVKTKWQHKKVGNIDYYYDWNDNLNMKDAVYFDSFNDELAAKFGLEPIEFDYFQCKFSRNVFDVQGYDLHPAKYFSDQSGGMADTYNHIIYSGNGKAIYTHELVHLYSRQRWKNSHIWFDEGLATYLGGSRELPFEWHLTELNSFAKAYPDYQLSDIDTLQYFKNDSFDLQFKYNIGVLIINEIIEKHGFEYLDNVMGQGKETKDFYRILEKSLDVKKEDMDEWVRKKVGLFKE